MREKINLTEIIELSLILIAMCVVGYFGWQSDKQNDTIISQQRTIEQLNTTIESKDAEINRLNMVSDDWYGMFRECLRTSYETE